MTYTDGTDTSYESASEAIEVWETGCDTCAQCLDGNDHDECDTCHRGNLCTECGGEVDDAREALAKEEEIEADIVRESQMAFYDLVEEMEGYDADEVLELLIENASHSGGLTHTIRMAYDPETKTITLADEEIEHIITMLGVSSARHNDTDYDDMLARGIDRDVARMLIR